MSLQEELERSVQQLEEQLDTERVKVGVFCGRRCFPAEGLAGALC